MMNNANRNDYCVLKNKNILLLSGEENPALPILKSLGSKGASLTVASHTKFAPGLHSKYTFEKLISPNPWKVEKDYVEWSLNVCKSQKFDMIIPLGEKASFWIAKNKKRFEKYVPVPFPDFMTYLIFRDKSETMKVAKKLGIPIPETFYPDETNMEDIHGQISYPVVVKPNVSYGARGIFFPRNKEELIAQLEYAKSSFGPCSIQEYIPQTGMQYKVETVSDKSGSVKAVGIYDKPRYYPTTGGSSTLNRTVHNTNICDLAVKLVEGIKWYGMADCDFIEDPRDGVIKLMEVNPRFTRSIKILVEAGLDFPLILFNVANGYKTVCDTSYKAGLHMRYLLPDLMWFVHSKNRFRLQPSFFNFFGKNVIYEMLSSSDLIPGLYYLVGQMAKLFSRKDRKKLFRRD